MIYKIIFRILVKRLRGIVSSHIFPFQAAKNALIAQEVIFTISKKNSRKWGLMEIKLDLQKTCDKMEWKFLFK